MEAVEVVLRELAEPFWMKLDSGHGTLGGPLSTG